MLCLRDQLIIAVESLTLGSSSNNVNENNNKEPVALGISSHNNTGY